MAKTSKDESLVMSLLLLVSERKIIFCRYIATTSYNMAYIFSVGSAQSTFIIAIRDFSTVLSLLFLRYLVRNSWSWIVERYFSSCKAINLSFPVITLVFIYLRVINSSLIKSLNYFYCIFFFQCN